jgi:hypothetical protein
MRYLAEAQHRSTNNLSFGVYTVPNFRRDHTQDEAVAWDLCHETEGLRWCRRFSTQRIRRQRFEGSRSVFCVISEFTSSNDDADLSIAPSNVGAVSVVSLIHLLTDGAAFKNTYSTALVIGEKAAFIIAQELGISVTHSRF